MKSILRGDIPPPQYVFTAWCLVKLRDNFTFTFYSIVVSYTYFMMKEKKFISEGQCVETSTDNDVSLAINLLAYN